MNDEYGNAKKALDADWEMKASSFETTKLPKIADEIAAQIDSNEEIITVVRSSGAAAAKEKEDEWKMPEPVFRVSSGKTPDKTAKPNNDAPNDLPFTKAISLEENVTAAAPVQAQPNISTEFTVRDAIEKQPAEKEQKTLSIVMVALGIAAIVVFAIAFLAAVYFLFFYKTEI